MSVSKIVVDGDLSEGQMRGLERDGVHVLLCNVGGNHFAISGICSHARVMLSMGELCEAEVTCPLHGAKFDVRTGQCLTGPQKMDLATYPVTRQDDVLIITVSDESTG